MPCSSTQSPRAVEMEFGLDAEEISFLEHVVSILDPIAADVEAKLAKASDRRFHSPLRVFMHEFTTFLDTEVGFRDRMRSAALVGVGWPPEYGGQGRSALQ